MNVLCPTPDEKFGTIAELNGSLVNVDNEQSTHMQTLEDTILYPSIEFELIEQSTNDYAIYSKDEANVLETAYNNLLNVAKQQWKERGSVIEENVAYKKVHSIYNQVYNTFFKTPEATLEHPLFNANDTTSIRCIAWHPHLENVVAVAHKDDGVYIYKKKDLIWTCQVLANEKMKHITCIEWKSRSSGTIAVGCKEGVCIWQVDSIEYSSSTPRYHPQSFMKYVYYPGQQYISSLTWDPTPGSHLLAIVSAVSNTLVIHDTLLDRTIPLKRYGKGNIILRWSPSGEWLFEGGSSGTSRMWDTSDWTSQQIHNPPGLWIQTACWSPDNRTLVYSMCGKSDIHALFLSGKSIRGSIHDAKLVSTPISTVMTESGDQVSVGGVIRDMTMDCRNGQRLAVAYENSPLIALYSVKRVSPLNLRQDDMLFHIGYMRGIHTSYQSGSLQVSPLHSHPVSIRFSPAYKNGALMAIGWDNGTVSFVTHSFLTGEELSKRFN